MIVVYVILEFTKQRLRLVSRSLWAAFETHHNVGLWHSWAKWNKGQNCSVRKPKLNPFEPHLSRLSKHWVLCSGVVWSRGEGHAWHFRAELDTVWDCLQAGLMWLLGVFFSSFFFLLVFFLCDYSLDIMWVIMRGNGLHLKRSPNLCRLHIVSAKCYRHVTCIAQFISFVLVVNYVAFSPSL